MLDNLANVDLSGIGGYIRYSYDSFNMMIPSLILAIFVSIFFLLMGMSIYTLVTGTKSERYKRFLTDMWVVGKIKQLAEEDKVNLDEEIKEFTQADKKAKLYQKSLTYIVEDEMKKKVAGLEEQVKPKK